MTQRKKSVSFVLLFSLATLLLFGLAVSAYAQPYQTVTLTSTPEPVVQGGTVDVTFTYNTSDNRDDLTGFGAIFCFDSSALIYQSYTGIKAETLLAAAIKVYDDTNDQCGFGATGKKIPLVYKEKEGVKFTSAGLPADLMKFTFQAANTNTTTTVKSIGTIKAAGYTIQDGSATITIGVPTVTAIPQTVAEADTLYSTSGLVIIDVADAAAYAAGRITGAKTLADFNLTPPPSDTPILVYCRDAANAKTEADKLVAAGFTKVYYLNDIFANWVATVNSVQVEYKLAVTIAGTGTGTVSDGTQNVTEKWYTKGTAVTLTATPATGSKFDGFSGDSTTGAVTMDASKNVTATFSPDGTVNNPPVANAASFEVNQDVQLSNNLTGTDADGDTLIFSIVTQATHGVVTVNSNGAFIYQPGAGYSGIDTFTFKVNDGKVDSAPATVTITVKPVVTDKYTVNASAGPNGSISPSGSVEVSVGQSQTFTITPNSSGYVVEDVVVDNVSQGAITSYTFPTTTTGTHTISVTFKSAPVNIYTVNASAGPNGSISPSGTVEVNVGQTQTFTITPDTANGYVVDAVLVDGVSKGAVTSYTFPATTTAGTHTIVATFKIEGTETPNGDGNCDDVTDIYDALLAAMYDNDPTSVTVCELDMLDVNQDGVVNTNDALAIAKYDVGLTCNCILDAKK